MKKTQAPTITFHKERLDKDGEHKHCCLCRYGKKKGIILWRVEFRGEMLGFHWLLCNRCRFLLFVAMGGRMLEASGVETETPPKQRVSSHGQVRSSFYFACSPDRQEAMDSGKSLRQYENEMFGKMDKLRDKKKKKKKRKGLI